jgi:uncharacterized protein YlxW (UPF0749 family)
VGTIGVTLVLAAAGLLFATSAETAKGTQLRSDVGDMPGLIAAETERQRDRTRRVQALQDQVEAQTRDAAAGNRTVRGLRDASDRLSLSAGLQPVSGPGLSVTLDDAPADRPVPDAIAPDELVVHQQDVQAVVNALWAGGAEAMMLQDQRVISTSAVRCVGNTLILQGRVYSPPYTVRAIGPVDVMRRAMESTTWFAFYQEYVERLGLGLTVRADPALKMPAYAGSLDLRYAQVPTTKGQP